MSLKSKELALKIGDVLREKQAEDIVILDIHKLTVIADYFIIASGRSQTHINAIYDGLTREISHLNLNLKGRDGDKNSDWIALDFGDIIVHIFKSGEREFYDIERLWADAPIEKIE
ncbi:MAG: ribosome silencing factor [Clostridiales bacterium]|nr:ribosome silencing factor [Clostridiales bacterium]